VLLARFGSGVEALTVAVFVEPDVELKVAARTLIVTTAVLFTLKLPRLQETVVVEAVYVQLPFVLLDELYVTCDGIGSVTTTFCAVAGPALNTVSVYVSVVP
jgi:hypothetical protein